MASRISRAQNNLGNEQQVYFRGIVGMSSDSTAKKSIRLKIIIPRTTSEATRVCAKFHRSNFSSANKNILSKRRKYARLSEEFHRKADTLTPAVKQTLEDLQEEDTLLLESGHQPNPFPYARTMRKPIMLHAIGSRIREQDISVAEVFGFHDQDFASARWFRRTFLPNFFGRGGALYISAQISAKDERAAYAVRKPSSQIVEKWKKDIEQLYQRHLKFLGALIKEGPKKNSVNQTVRPVITLRVKQLHDLIDECHYKAETYTEFNEYFFSKLVNDFWGLPTAFTEYSKTERLFKNELEHILRHRTLYVKSFNEAWDFLKKEGAKLKFGKVDEDHVPFWYICTHCKGKVPLRGLEDKPLIVEGECHVCGQRYLFSLGDHDNPDLSQIINQISARAASRHLVFFSGLGVSTFVSGTGAMYYNTVARHIANKMKLPFPPVVFWSSRDKYLGISQATAFLTMKRMGYSVDLQNPRKDLQKALSELNREVSRKKAEIAASESKILMIEKEKKEMQNLQREMGIRGEKKLLRELKKKWKALDLEEKQLAKDNKIKALMQKIRDTNIAERILTSTPSIIDFVVTFGFDVGKMWLQWLAEKESLSKDITLPSAISAYS